MVIWAMTNKCNLSCRGCSFSKLKQKAEVGLEDIDIAIDFFKDNNVKMVALTGGEPLMLPHLKDLVEKLRMNNIVIAYIATNGTLVDDEKAKILAQANITGLSVNLDYFLSEGSPRAAEGERIRNVVSALKRNSVNFYGGVIISKITKDIEKTCNEMRSLGIEKISFSYPQMKQISYMAASEDPLLDLSGDEVVKVVEEIKAIKKRIPVYNTDESLDEFARYYGGRGFCYSCMGGRRIFYLDWNLDLYPCFNKKKIGNLNEVNKLPSCEASCKKCSQHAFKDPSIFYHAIEGLYLIKRDIFSGDISAAYETLKSEQMRGSAKSLFEIARGPFI